jgi:hypothetical protein
LPVAPVIKIMSSGPFLEMVFVVGFEWLQLPQAGAALRGDTVVGLTSFGVQGRQID